MTAGLWDDADIIHVYTRAQGIADGVLVDVTDTAREAGFTVPVALTRAAYEDLVAWPEDAEKRKGFTGQSDAGRLWDVLWMAWNAARRSSGQDRVVFQVLRVPREGRGLQPRKVTAVAVCGPGDTPAPVVTIMLPGES